MKGSSVAKQISLREFQQGLAQRLREAQAEAEPTSRLGVQAGSGNWLLRLDDAGEMLPLPEISGVPLTRPWYLGLANIRGVLASVVDFSAFAGGETTARTPDCRLLLIAERFQSFSGLVISRMLGLKNVQSMQPVQEGTTRPWIAGTYRDDEGRLWHELDIGALVAHEDFLHVGA
jgi:twitching motility protein PilI